MTGHSLFQKLTLMFPKDEQLMRTFNKFSRECVVYDKEHTEVDSDGEEYTADADDEGDRDVKEVAVTTVMTAWYKQFKGGPYNLLLMRDPLLWKSLEEGELAEMNISAKFNKMSDKNKAKFMTIVHQMTILTRKFAGDPIPKAGRFHDILHKYSSMESTDDNMAAFQKEFLDEVINSNSSIARFMDEFTGGEGLDGIMDKFADPETNPLRKNDKTTKKKRRRVRAVMEQCYKQVVTTILGPESEDSGSESDDDDESDGDE